MRRVVAAVVCSAVLRCVATIDIEVASERIVAQSLRWQCSGAAVAMPCPQAAKAPIFALHIPKTGGRSLWTAGEKASGQALCDWAPMRFSHYKQSIAYSGRRDRRSVPPDFGNTSLFAEVVASRIGDLAKNPCLTTYEAPWGAVAAFGPATPVVMTMVREPTAWRLSVVEHGHERGRHGDADALFDLGCFRRSRHPCDLFKRTPLLLTTIVPTVPLLLSNHGREATWARFSQWPDGGGGPWVPDVSLAEAKRHLAASVFGVTEYFEESTCLFAYQFGTYGKSKSPYSEATCDCRRRAKTTGKNRFASRAHAGNVSKRTLDALEVLARGAEAEFHAYALDLFFGRVRAFERATGTRLVCDDYLADV